MPRSSSTATKPCSNCKRVLPLSEFYRSKGKLYAPCKRCHNARVRRWERTAAGRESVKRSRKKYKRKYYRSEHRKAVVATYRQRPEYKAGRRVYERSARGKARQRRYWQSEKGRAAARRHRQSPKTKATLARLKAEGRLQEYQRKYRRTPKGQATLHRQNTSEKGSARLRKYRHSEKGRATMAAVQRRHAQTEKGHNTRLRHEFKRRAIEAQAENTLTYRQWKEIKARFRNACAYCGRSDVRLEKDHFIPVIPRDAATKAGGNVKENIVPACRRCNARKSNKVLPVTVLGGH